MGRFFAVTIFVAVPLLFNACSITWNRYTTSASWPGYRCEIFPQDTPSVATNTYLTLTEEYFPLRAYFQSFYPKKYENYNIRVTISDKLDKTDNMRGLYISDARVVLPTGEAINLLDNRITLRYIYWKSEYYTGIPSRQVDDIQLQYRDYRRVVCIDSLAHEDWVNVIFNADIPSAVGSVVIEYTL